MQRIKLVIAVLPLVVVTFAAFASPAMGDDNLNWRDAQGNWERAWAPSTIERVQVDGQTLHCGPWHKRWDISRSGWWYFWWWRWCYDPSIEGGWHRHWAGWDWDVFAGPGFTPGFQYDTGPVQIGVVDRSRKRPLSDHLVSQDRGKNTNKQDQDNHKNTDKQGQDNHKDTDKQDGNTTTRGRLPLTGPEKRHEGGLQLAELVGLAQ
jgi:hypothetical protein